MKLENDYAVTLFFSNPSFTQIYFEAIANAFDANANNISIEISTDGNISPEQLEIIIKDDGEGLTDERYARFAEIRRPKDKFHKGMGRLVYLNYFSSVRVVSVYGDKKRTLNFSKSYTGESTVQDAEEGDTQGTTLRFSGFTGERLKTYDDLKPSYLQQRIVEQFLPYMFDRKKNQHEFSISISLETSKSNPKQEFFSDSTTIAVANVPSFEAITYQDDTVDAFSDITIHYWLKSEMGEKTFLTAASVDGRTIPVNILHPTSIPLNHSAIFLFESELFNGNSDTARQRLSLPEGISERDLYKSLRSQISAILNEQIPELAERNQETKGEFESKYPHLTGYFEEETVGLINKDEAIEVAQQRYFKDQKEILECESLDDKTFKKSLKLSSRTLTEYILYRERIIKKLGEISEKDREDVVHNLIAPRGKSFEGDSLVDDIYTNNAWLLDDKFMSFRTILSEARMQNVIEKITVDADASGEISRPDISMIFSADPDGDEMVDVVIVELKRKTDDLKENTYASSQLVQRARKLIDYCPNIQRAWYFGIIDISESLDQYLRDDGWAPLYSKGKVYYAERKLTRNDGSYVPTPLCLMSFDSVVGDAAARNHTFLEILKSDLKRAVEEKSRIQNNAKKTIA
ncbi:ATP-binding protein [Pelagicoccus sp. SDUM812005]|uniref:ATP-binding protein n=1 Tax=Pelagicoccus sp. SDUM812005 TaxID=3041257 RepID=UPI00280CDBED|nr:ATP-binding protein [Pelagicoccus sp. SDUM812005]MDQ8181895.1 ATP-binding protein [Pelagicoccus sp. SDUM812005]